MYNVAQTDWLGTVLLGVPVVTSGLAPVRVMLDGSAVFTAIFSPLPAANHLFLQTNYFVLYSSVRQKLYIL